MVYFTTYAMHHFEASRIIQSQILDLFLLAFVVIGMLVHVLRYKSETMTGLTLIVAYITATLGHVTMFTFASLMLLSVVILVFAYKFQWVKTLVGGIIFTYLFHHLWIANNDFVNYYFRGMYARGQVDVFLNLVFFNC